MTIWKPDQIPEERTIKFLASLLKDEGLAMCCATDFSNFQGSGRDILEYETHIGAHPLGKAYFYSMVEDERISHIFHHNFVVDFLVTLMSIHAVFNLFDFGEYSKDYVAVKFIDKIDPLPRKYSHTLLYTHNVPTIREVLKLAEVTCFVWSDPVNFTNVLPTLSRSVNCQTLTIVPRGYTIPK